MSENSATSGFHGVSEIVIMDTTNTPLGELKKALQDLDRNGWISIGNEEVYLVHGTYKRSANSLVQLNDESNPKSKGKFTNSAHDAVWNDLLEYVIFFDQSVIHFEFKEFFDAVSETVLIDDYKHKLTPPLMLTHSNSNSSINSSNNSTSHNNSSFNDECNSSNNSFVDEDASAVAMIENTREKTIYENRGKPCDYCNAKNGDQCQKEVIYNSKCLSSSVRTEV